MNVVTRVFPMIPFSVHPFLAADGPFKFTTVYGENVQDWLWADVMLYDHFKGMSTKSMIKVMTFHSILSRLYHQGYFLKTKICTILQKVSV